MSETHHDTNETHELVKKAYGEVAAQQSSCCGSGEQLSCPPGPEVTDHPVPESDLGLSCGNPVEDAALKPGEAVLDLGSGAGRDVFLAAKAVGETGCAIGVDMTPQMLKLARRNAEGFKLVEGFDNVEFREGQIEELPVSDDSIDVVLSNCVINLSPDKPKVFREVHRVLKPGGRMINSDIVLNRELPKDAKTSDHLYTSCISGALLREDYLAAIRDAGFARIEILKDTGYAAEQACCDPVTSGLAGELVGCAASITVLAVKD